jgi:hypothetical protein
MLEFLRGKATDRKLRLIACACCRRIWRLLTDPAAGAAVEVSEQFADGFAAYEQLSKAYKAIKVVVDRLQLANRQATSLAASHAGSVAVSSHRAARCAARLNRMQRAAQWAVAAVTTAGVPTVAAEMRGPYTPEDGERMLREARSPEYAGLQARCWEAENRAQCQIVRCVIGNYFRPVTFDPAWLTTTAIALAHSAYDERLLPGGELDPVRLGLLADAMEEAGADGEVLNHLRGPGPHVRGCHVIDALTGRS